MSADESDARADGIQSASRQLATARYVRGSTLLLAGRLVALLTNFAVQVLTVRYLAKSDYGAFAYALAVASMGASIASLGLNRGVNRFVPIDHEMKNYASMFGTMLLAVGAVAGLGLAIVVLVIGAQGVPGRSAPDDPLPAALLLILIGLAPLQALDSLFEGMTATFASPLALCVRRFLIGPGLKLAAVLVVVLGGGSVLQLAWCYLLAGGIGVALYALVLYRALKQGGLLEHFPGRRLVPGVRRLLAFSLPLLSTDLFLTLKVTLAVMILEAFRGTTDVADLRAVAPVAGLCAIVLQSFKMLFSPTAARFFARGDTAGLSDLYWRSTVWISVATFPIFGVCFFLAEPVTVLLFGARYESAGIVLAILAVGIYVNAALGLNLYVLQVYARVRLIAAINALAMLLSIGLDLWLIPLYGATGAAAAITLTVVAHNLLVQVGLGLYTDVEALQPRALRAYGTIGIAFAAMLLVRSAWDWPAVILVAALAIVSAVLLRANRGVLEIGDAFPQLARVPLLGRAIGVQCG